MAQCQIRRTVGSPLLPQTVYRSRWVWVSELVAPSQSRKPPASARGRHEISPIRQATFSDCEGARRLVVANPELVFGSSYRPSIPNI
jgi:hypothetical protein